MLFLQKIANENWNQFQILTEELVDNLELMIFYSKGVPIIFEDASYSIYFL